MPKGDRTGPMGAGAMSGRAAGYCAGQNMPGYAHPMNAGGGGMRAGRRRGGWGGPAAGGRGWCFRPFANGLKVVSAGFFLCNLDDALIWRGPLKMAAIKQFLKDVAWGDLDYLIVDSPPGTGDEPLSVCQLIGNLDGAVIVTTPQRAAASDVRKSITFCRQLEVPILGVVENMNGFACPHCGDITFVFGAGGGRRMAAEMKVPFLGSIPIDPEIAEACDNGRAYVYHYALSSTAGIMAEIIRPIAALDGTDSDLPRQSKSA